MKKLCAVVLFAFLASFFAVGVAFAGLNPVISDDHRFIQPALRGVSDQYVKQSQPNKFFSPDATDPNSKAEWDVVAKFNQQQVDSFENVEVGPFPAGGAYVSHDVAEDILSFLYGDKLDHGMNYDNGFYSNNFAAAGHVSNFVPVVIWSADTGGGTSVEPLVAAMFMLSDDRFNASWDLRARQQTLRGYYGKRAKDIVAVKGLGDGYADGRPFTQVFSTAELIAASEAADVNSRHVYAVVKVETEAGLPKHTILGADDRLDPAKKYAVLVTIQKGASRWDFSKASGDDVIAGVDFANIIVDPMFIATFFSFNPYSNDIDGVRPDVVVPSSSAWLLTEEDQINIPNEDMDLTGLLNEEFNMLWIAEEAPALSGYSDLQFLPVVSADVPSGAPNRTVSIVQMLRAEDFANAETVGDLKVVTAKEGRIFDLIDDPALFDDGKAMIVVMNNDGDFEALKLTDTIAGKNIWVAIAVKDGGDFDFDKTDKLVVCPIAVAGTGSAKPEPTNPFTAVPAIDGLPTGLATPDATVVFANLTETGLTTAAQGAVNTAGTEVNGGVQYYMSSTVASAILAAHEADLGTSPISQATVPVMKAALPTGTSAAAFAFPIASSFAGKTVGDVKFYKAVNGTAADAKEFELVQTGAAITDGKFAIVTSAGVVKTASETVATGDLVVYAIADGGDFDLDGAVNSSISDPVLVACDNTAAPTSGGDSSSGCSVGGFAPATLLLLAPLFLLLKK